MPGDSGLPSNRLPTDRGAAKTPWLFWLLAGFSLCAAITAITLAVVYVVLPAQRQQLGAEGWVEHTSDDGPGIPEQFHRRIFEIFQTLQSRDDHEASGIGLAI